VCVLLPRKNSSPMRIVGLLLAVAGVVAANANAPFAPIVRLALDPRC
jgi:hypothetical protein